jgi:UDPglucose 6-dehydrogenase
VLRNHDRLLVMDTRSAELTKYAANAMLATRISFMNDLANLAERLGADIEAVRHGMGSDQRIGYHFLYAGVGYGGSCFPKDIQALQHIAGEYGMRSPSWMPWTRSIARRNSASEKVRVRFGEQLGARRFALWGLAFKPGTDDMRDAEPRRDRRPQWRAAPGSSYDRSRPRKRVVSTGWPAVNCRLARGSSTAPMG